MIQEIELNKLLVHPNNVRKAYNDIDELADSIKSRGILQNLTVVPNPEEPGTYLTVIGNRRLTAARLAGLETAPCCISSMDEKEQASAMLLENMQRNDLTIYEQAQGFQMMLEFGETEDTIAEKTGFSKTTVRHRLNIAKLDQKKLQEKEADADFQLSLKDLYALEKVADIKKRNQILSEAQDSRDLARRAQSYADNEKREANAGKIIKMLEDAGVKPGQRNGQINWMCSARCSLPLSGGAREWSWWHGRRIIMRKPQDISRSFTGYSPCTDCILMTRNRNRFLMARMNYILSQSRNQRQGRYRGEQICSKCGYVWSVCKNTDRV